jgi:hypothetical protein
MRIHPGAAATISLLLQRGARDEEIDGIIELMAIMDNSPGKTYLTQINDFDRAIQTYRRKKNPLVLNPPST